jgi:hypothetical protein
MKPSRNKISADILSRFHALADEFGLRRRGMGGADEWVDRYQDHRFAVTITLSYPELPLVVLLVKQPQAAGYVFSLSRNREAKRLKRRYYALLEHNSRAHAELVELQGQVSGIQVAALRAALHQLAEHPRTAPGDDWLRVRASSC